MPPRRKSEKKKKKKTESKRKKKETGPDPSTPLGKAISAVQALDFYELAAFIEEANMANIKDITSAPDLVSEAIPYFITPTRFGEIDQAMLNELQRPYTKFPKKYTEYPEYVPELELPKLVPVGPRATDQEAVIGIDAARKGVQAAPKPPKPRKPTYPTCETDHSFIGQLLFGPGRPQLTLVRVPYNPKVPPYPWQSVLNRLDRMKDMPASDFNRFPQDFVPFVVLNKRFRFLQLSWDDRPRFEDALKQFLQPSNYAAYEKAPFLPAPNLLSLYVAFAGINETSQTLGKRFAIATSATVLATMVADADLSLLQVSSSSLRGEGDLDVLNQRVDSWRLVWLDTLSKELKMSSKALHYVEKELLDTARLTLLFWVTEFAKHMKAQVGGLEDPDMQAELYKLPNWSVPTPLKTTIAVTTQRII